MGLDNGNSKMFGPHGEGCDCPWPNEEKDVDPSDATRTMYQVATQNPSDLFELILGAIADAYAAELTDLAILCDYDGERLTEKQTVRLIGMLMRGHAAAKRASDAVRQNYLLEALRTYEAERAETVKTEPDSPNQFDGFADISELFRQDPE